MADNKKKDFTLSVRPDQAEKLALLFDKLSTNATAKYLLKKSGCKDFTLMELKSFRKQLETQLEENPVDPANPVEPNPTSDPGETK